ncbi:PhzF family phenazine biosynthesis protein [Segnochrobactrum spirostomi]|uniref:PhzF family phenazine biosynthesis protein n=1 Tax=Segnochrobactrum spirostomi TaxID=2608987 RepID=A0A6A7Y575_9HYPH|nr:PhzF family phenazine biosynthesis protein [Segnochrobactrum spirostomi]MQT14343.1 PhzF family phenazine biosynthesis protein [Segnochrobactrum spirostomi]
MASIEFVTVDVFTRQRFGGNPLAVVPDAGGLSTEEMQAIAAEFGYSESTFVLPPEDPANTARVRIFTPTDEIPFAGHPNVGTAFVLGRRGEAFGRPVGEAMVFEEIAGRVEVALAREEGAVVGAEIVAPRPLAIHYEIDPALVAACASLTADDLAPGWQPVMASVGLPFVFAEVRDLAALGRAAPLRQAFAEADRRHPRDDDHFAVFLFHRLDDHIRARMFAPLSNTEEDPATGSASAALAAHLAALDPASDFPFDRLIVQGVEMGRRSEIRVRTSKTAGTVAPVRVSGACVPVLAGTIAL